MANRKRRRQYGTGEVIRKPSGKFLIRWYEGERRRSKGGFASREDAVRVLAMICGQIAQDRTGLPRDPKDAPTLGEIAGGERGFLERRKLTHRAGAEDAGRWKNHLAPAFAHLRPAEVDVARIRAFVEAELAQGANPATVRIYVALLSSLFVDLQERGIATANPARGLPASVRRLMRSTHDPRTTPFVEKVEDVRRIFLALPRPLHVGYAIGALAGLRTGEVLALRWQHVDLPARRIHVRESIDGPLKDKDSRMVPILDALVPILTEWKLETGGKGRLVPPLRSDGEKVDKATPSSRLRKVLVKLGLHELAEHPKAWYCATRHTFASQWVMAGGSIEKLKEILGHYSVVVTERYAHLKPELFTAKDLGTIAVDLRPGDGPAAAIGHQTGTTPRPNRATTRNNKRSAGAVL